MLKLARKTLDYLISGQSSHFSSPGKTLFSSIFRIYKMGTLARNGLTWWMLCWMCFKLAIKLLQGHQWKSLLWCFYCNFEHIQYNLQHISIVVLFWTLRKICWLVLYLIKTLVACNYSGLHFWRCFLSRSLFFRKTLTILFWINELRST